MLKKHSFLWIVFFISVLFVGRSTGLSSTIIFAPEEKAEVEQAFKRFITRERQFIQRGLSNAPYYLVFIKEVFEKENLPNGLDWLPLI